MELLTLMAVRANLRQILFEIEYKSLDFRTLVGLEIETAKIERRPMVCSVRLASKRGFSLGTVQLQLSNESIH